MSPVMDISRGALLARREELLKTLGIDAAEFRDIARTRTLTGEEWAAREELDAIAFLLGEGPVED